MNILFVLYRLLYGIFDWAIYTLDSNAHKSKSIPNGLMLCVSTFGLGFQLLLIAVFLVAGLAAYIFPFFLVYTLMVFVFYRDQKVVF